MKILITGASKGIGLFLMQRMIVDGHKVCGTYNTTKPEEALIPFFSKVNLVNEKQVVNWIKTVVSLNDKLVLINCAGTNYNVFAHKAKIEKWQHVIDVNLVGTFIAINTVLPYMREKGFGRIINFSSVVAQKGIAGTSAYAASKAALWGLTKSIAVENVSKGITINTLNLGYFNLGMTISDVPELIRKEIKNQIPNHEFGDPHDIYKAVKFLICTPYITGTSIDINGGLM